MKVYTVQITDKYYYDFSVSTIKCGCFSSMQAALQKAKKVYEKLCSEFEEDVEDYEDTAEIEEDPDTGYYRIAFGYEEDYEVHLITVDEWDVELDEFKFYLQKKNEYFLNDVKSKLEDMEISGLSDEDIKSIAYKAEKSLDWNDSYWESYWMSIEYAIEDYVANKITTQD